MDAEFQNEQSLKRIIILIGYDFKDEQLQVAGTVLPTFETKKRNKILGVKLFKR